MCVVVFYFYSDKTGICTGQPHPTVRCLAVVHNMSSITIMVVEASEKLGRLLD